LRHFLILYGKKLRQIGGESFKRGGIDRLTFEQKLLRQYHAQQQYCFQAFTGHAHNIV
jgi:hypothetical protein